jgi:DeoR/GlpR family transcriptional regulator of sugar metabolism
MRNSNLELTNLVRAHQKSVRQHTIKWLLDRVTLKELVSLKKVETVPVYLSKKLGVSLSTIHNDLIEINKH